MWTHFPAHMVHICVIYVEGRPDLVYMLILGHPALGVILGPKGQSLRGSKVFFDCSSKPVASAALY